MTPNDVTAEERYGFFKMFDQYAPKEGSAVTSSETESYCDSFLNDHIFTHIGSPKEFCKKFKYLYNILRNISRKGKQDGEFDDNDCSFLNYWLNDNLRGVNADPTISIEHFYQKSKAADGKIFKSTLLDKKLYNIEKHDLENMRRLYDLYKIRTKVSETMGSGISKEESTLCLTYTKAFYEKYRDAIINCLGDCSYFYSILTDFKNKYKDEFILHTEESFSCKSEELFLLPHYRTVLKEHESVRIIRNTTLSVFLPLFGVFLIFKFSDKLIPFSQQFLEKIKSTKNMLLGARERSNELLSYTSYNDNIIGDHDEYSIRYYSVGNY
ncbi:PIR Superfamily Protein [Plasmodium ovale wallikeri]|uniref:PIR Superfamily Protein n=1 Tax=Plasmodium ovale wallikeri TaxID=864142 RepID=A0A1A9AI19_PLAOA|nr:PIR Superfamily Protein [Plasmodium ovale wallikeri]